MTQSIDEQWKELCEEFEKARDAVDEAMADRGPGTYQSAEFWENLRKAQAQWEVTQRKMEDFRKAHGGP
jgi:hypothetical protein